MIKIRMDRILNLTYKTQNYYKSILEAHIQNKTKWLDIVLYKIRTSRILFRKLKIEFLLENSFMSFLFESVTSLWLFRLECSTCYFNHCIYFIWWHWWLSILRRGIGIWLSRTRHCWKMKSKPLMGTSSKFDS